MVDVSFQNGPLDVLIFGQVVLLILTPQVKVTQTPAREGLDTTPVFSLGNYDFRYQLEWSRVKTWLGSFWDLKTYSPIPSSRETSKSYPVFWCFSNNLKTGVFLTLRPTLLFICWFFWCNMCCGHDFLFKRSWIFDHIIWPAPSSGPPEWGSQRNQLVDRLGWAAGFFGDLRPENQQDYFLKREGIYFV